MAWSCSAKFCTKVLNDQRRAALQASVEREVHWKRWGPYLSERQWGTVREDYSANGDAWGYFPHDHARSRAYRWGEDGIAGICDRHQHICFALALWNEKDPILKERLFGLTNREGNHGEDVKEYYYYLDATPTSSYLKYLYKYPQAAFPYAQLVDENARRTRHEPEYELIDTGVFQREPLFRRVRRVRERYRRRHPDPHHRLEPRARTRASAPAANVLVSQPLGLGRSLRSSRSRTHCTAGRRSAHRVDTSITTASDGCSAKARRSCSSPRMRRTSSASIKRQNRTPYVKDAFHRYSVNGEQRRRESRA